MNKYFLITILATNLLCYDAFAQCGLDKSNWQLVYSEDFNQANAATLFAQGNWHNGQAPNAITSEVCGPGSAIICWSENQLSLNSGLAYFNMVKKAPFSCQNKTATYEGAMLTSTFSEFPYPQYKVGNLYDNGYVWGMFEIRCKLPQTSGLYPAFWLSGSNAWPPEIDAFEFNASTPNQFFSTVHWQDATQPLNDGYCSSFYSYAYNLANDFHTFTLVWTPSKMTWFLDGKELKTDNEPTHQPGQPLVDQSLYEGFFTYTKMHAIVNTGLNCPNSATSSFDPLIVDYVKIYKPNGYVPITSNQNAQQYYNAQVSLYNSTPYKSSSDWVTTPIKSTQPYSVTGNLNGAQGAGLYYYNGADGYLNATYWTSINSPHFESTRITPNITNPLATSLSQNGDIVFYSRLNGAFSSISYLQNGTLNTVFQTLTSDAMLAYFIASPNGLNIYYFNNSGKLIRYSRPSLTSHTWTRSESNYYASLDSKIIVGALDQNTIFYKTSTNNIGWLNFSTLAGSTLTNTNDVGSNIALAANEKTLFYKDNQNQIRVCTKPLLSPAFWNNSILYVRNGASDVPVTHVKDGLCTNLNPTSSIQLYFQGTDNRPWYIYWDGSKYVANSFDWAQVNVSGDFQIIKQGVSNYETIITYKDIYGQIRIIRWQSPCEVPNPPCGGSTVASQKKPLKNDSHIENSLPKEKILLYPNPASNSLTIESNVLVRAYDIISAAGKIIIQGSIAQFANQKITLDISDLSVGLFFIRITLADGRKVSYKFNKL